MDCRNCGAPLPANDNVCVYCKTRHDVDLQSLNKPVSAGAEGNRICPRCEEKLTALRVTLGSHKATIDRCKSCLGIFFDPGELEELVDASVKKPDQVDYRRLNKVSHNRRLDGGRAVRYLKCPVCRELMNRKSYKTSSGIIIDICRDHGVWLDGGELNEIMHWTHAGGEIHAEEKKRERQHLEDTRRSIQSMATGGTAYTHGAGNRGWPGDDAAGLGIGAVIGFIIRSILD